MIYQNEVERLSSHFKTKKARPSRFEQKKGAGRLIIDFETWFQDILGKSSKGEAELAAKP